jgi:DNA polymerase-3 subunit gamma/tau
MPDSSESHVTALRFRPKTFEQVVGQEAIAQTLKNAITSDRIHHAYLFTGARGVGKTTTARILAKALNCKNGPTVTPCGVCASCVEIASSSSVDVLEIDAASNTGVENVRTSIIGSASGSPWRDRYRIFIIDEVHQLSAHAFGALLKTIEEPPPRVVFIMATTEAQKVPETILSRCQVFEFRAIPLRKVADQLRLICQELKVEITDSALAAIARAGEGSMRDAESSLDQVLSFAGNVINDNDVSVALGIVDIATLNTTMEAISRQDGPAILEIADQVITRGYDVRNFCREMMAHVRTLLVIKIAGLDSELVQMPPSEGETLVRLSNEFTEQDLIRFFSILTKIEQDIKVSSQPRFQLEIGMVKLAQAERLYLLEEVLGKLDALSGRKAAPDRQPGAASSRTSANRPVVSAAGPPVARPHPSGSGGAAPNSQDTDARATARTQPEFVRASAPEPVRAQSVPNRLAPPEAPAFNDEPDEVVESYEPAAPKKGPIAESGTPGVREILRKLESRRKMMLLTELEKADVRIEGSVLRVSLPPQFKDYKASIESRESRKVIEEACQEAVGHSLTLSVTVGKTAGTGDSSETVLTDRPEDRPAVRDLIEKFHGEVVDVTRADRTLRKDRES